MFLELFINKLRLIFFLYIVEKKYKGNDVSSYIYLILIYGYFFYNGGY